MSDSASVYDIAATELCDRQARRAYAAWRDEMLHGPVDPTLDILCLGCRKNTPRDTAYVVHPSELTAATGFCTPECVEIALLHAQQDADDYPPD